MSSRIIHFLLSAIILPFIPLHSEFQTETGFYLLPSPYDLKAGRSPVFELLSAPVIDGPELERMAEKNEAASRKELKLRTEAIQKEICSLEKEDRKKKIEVYRISLNTDHEVFNKLADFYDKSIWNAIREDLSESPYRTSFAEWQEKYTPLQQLRSDREKAVLQYWEKLLESSKKKAFCRENFEKNILEDITIKERLYLPYYLSLYRFYSSLPPDYRFRLLKKLHSL